ncbi:uncharacterized protein EDB91DRAFT_1065475 [Suillus paluster]|uniref:uncharacterized protein n=1 Tax=Suillus paluster TaxID=48578 RepID=UPI001B87F495|nr:uncharacterized protein EDB91DRAFT_1065475 [Suillus paluster]KAG1719627.1 hypothetical protein EDB91DRAFT_1065475 [Suillus paluster]
MSGHSPFSDSVRAVSGSTDRSAPVWDIPEVREIGEPLFGYDHWVNCVTGSPYDTRVAGDADAKRPVNEAADRRALGCAWRFSLSSLFWSPDGKHLASGFNHGILQFWETTTGRPAGDPLDLQVQRTFSITLSVKDNLVVVRTGYIHLWKLEKRHSAETIF